MPKRHLEGRTALITGASRGIGRALALRFSAEGARVVLSASRAGAHGELSGTLEDAVDEIRSRGGDAQMEVANLVDDAERADLVERAQRHFGAIDVLVNNAAMARWGMPGTLSLKDRRKMMEVNFHAPVDLIQQALRGMLDAGRGAILNITSESARQPAVPYRDSAEAAQAIAGYGSTKAALDRYTLGLAHELSADAVSVNALAPVSIVLTQEAERFVGDIAAKNPDMVEPVEVMAEAALALVSEGHTARVVTSRPFLHSIGRTVMDLTGNAEIGDASVPANG